MLTSLSRKAKLFIYVTPVALLVGLPLCCWLLVWATQAPSGIDSDAMYYLFTGLIFWASTPEAIVGKGWTMQPSPAAALVFWGLVSVTISAGIHYFVHRRRTVNI